MSHSAKVVGRDEQNPAYAVTARRWIAKGSDVHVKTFTLAPGEEVPWHSHSVVSDIFFGLEGRLRIERIAMAEGAPLEALELGPGDEAQVDPGVAHRPFNPGPGPCRFLIVQGVGVYDYLPWPAPA